MKLHKSLLVAFVFTLACAAPLSAQSGKWIEVMGRQAAEQRAGSKVWENFPEIAPASSKTAAAAARIRNKTLKQKLAQKYPGVVVRYEQKINQKSLQQALRRVVELRGTRPAKGWPKVFSYSLTVPSLEGLTLDGLAKNAAAFPELPIPTNKIYLYRGMGLDENALRNILKNGLRPQDTGKDANELNTQLRLLNLGTMPVTQDMLKDLQVAQTYLAPNAKDPVHYAFLNSFEQGRVPVVVTVRGWRKGDYVHVLDQTVPAADFVEVSVLVKGPKGSPIWCRVRLGEDGSSLVLTPYLP